tara:strand:- start:941 stop:1243 length:303 start_codon:yes stop_codon:yes gene_type:complete
MISLLHRFKWLGYSFGQYPFSSAPQVQFHLAVSTIDELVIEGKAFEPHSAKTLSKACSWRLFQDRIDSINDSSTRFAPVTLWTIKGRTANTNKQTALYDT